MAEFQTVATSLNMVRGSAKIEVAPYTTGDPSWVDVGAAVGISAVEEVTIATEENDNADSEDRISKQELRISFTRFEVLNLDAWEIMRSSLDTITMESNTTKIQTGNKSTIPRFMVRLTTKNSGGTFYVVAYRCNIVKGMEFSYQKDDSEDTRIQDSVEIIAKTDSARGGLVFELEGPFVG